MEHQGKEQLARIREHQRTPIAEVIAEEKLVAEIGGKRREVILQIGRPYKVSDEEARCPVASWGLDDRHPDIPGGGTMQALNLACSLLHRRLIDSVESGNVRFFHPECPDDGPLPTSFLKSMFGRSRAGRRRNREPTEKRAQ